MDLPRNISINTPAEGGSKPKAKAGEAPAPAAPEVERTTQPEPDFSSAVQILTDPDKMAEWGRSYSTLPPIPHTVTELKQWFDDFATGLRASIEESMNRLDINITSPVELQVSAQGETQLSGTASEADKLSQLFEQQPALGGLLQQAANRYSLVQLMEQAPQLRQEGGAEQFRQQLANSGAFSLTLGQAATAE